MSYDIVRGLFALDWAATVAALRARGDDFFWLARDSNVGDIDYTRIPFVAGDDGAPGECAGLARPEREPDLRRPARASRRGCTQDM